MLKNNNGTCSLSEDSKAKLQSMEKNFDSQTPFAGAVDGARDDYYEVEKVLEVRINRKCGSKVTRLRMTCGCPALPSRSQLPSRLSHKGVASGCTE